MGKKLVTRVNVRYFVDRARGIAGDLEAVVGGRSGDCRVFRNQGRSSMSKAVRKRVFGIIRLVLCAGFVFLAVRGVTLHDWVTLAPESDDAAAGLRRLRLVEEKAATVVVLDEEGMRREIPWDRIARAEDGQPQIERGLLTALRASNPWYLACGLLIFAPVTFLQSARFQLMLRAQDIRITYWESVKLCFAGNFLNFVFLVGSTAGDVYKAYCTALHTEHKTEAVTTILLDRVVGLVGLVVVAGTMSFAGTTDPTLRQVGLVAWGLLGCVLFGVWLVSSGRAPTRMLRRVVAYLPASSTLERVLAAAERLVASRGRLAACVIIATVLQFFAVGAAVMLAYALGMDFSGTKLWDYFAYIGGGHMIAAIPITAQGLGTMELAYKHFFLGTYGTLAQLLCLALWIRLMNLLWALPGALVALRGAHRPRNMGMIDPDAAAVASGQPSNAAP